MKIFKKVQNFVKKFKDWKEQKHRVNNSANIGKWNFALSVSGLVYGMKTGIYGADKIPLFCAG